MIAQDSTPCQYGLTGIIPRPDPLFLSFDHVQEMKVKSPVKTQTKKRRPTSMRGVAPPDPNSDHVQRGSGEREQVGETANLFAQAHTHKSIVTVSVHSIQTIHLFSRIQTDTDKPTSTYTRTHKSGNTVSKGKGEMLRKGWNAKSGLPREPPCSEDW